MSPKLQLLAAAAVALMSRIAHAEEDHICTQNADGGCAATAPSLMQKTAQRDLKSAVAQEQPEAPENKACTGIEAQGRCWHLSELGESCAEACARKGRTFSFVIPDPKEPVTPLLVHHEPRTKQEPWAALECYVPSEDRYHPANENAARHYVKDIEYWEHENCMLACPCGGAASDQCTWNQPAACVSKFMWKGVEYSGCATVDTEHERPWCQHNYQHLEEKDTGNKGRDWSYCTYDCEPKGPERPEEKDQECSWQPNAACAEVFEYKGEEYLGCTGEDHPIHWCSHDRVHKGEWDVCKWSCRARNVEPAPVPEKPEPTDKPEKPTDVSGEPCDRHPDTENDFIGDSVTLDEVGYKIVTHVPAADSPLNMKRFVCRAVAKIGCKVVDLDAMMAFVPYYSGTVSGTTYAKLESELSSICQSTEMGGKWAVPLK